MSVASKNIADAAELLSKSRRLWLSTHIKSDGDGIGCELALARALKAAGKEVRIINSTPVPNDLKFLVREKEEVSVYDAARDLGFLKEVDTIVLLDAGESYRLGRLEHAFAGSAAVKICLDHHKGQENVFENLLADPDCGSTGEILYELLAAIGSEITEEIATPLFAAISIDTGSFSYERCNQRTFHIAGDLVAAGAAPYEIHTAYRWRKRVEELKLTGEVIQNLRIEGSNAIAYSEVTRDALSRYDIDATEMPEVVNIPLGVKDVEIAFLFIETAPCDINVSVRSKGRYAVDVLAREFGGGGHPLAAGFSMRSSLEEAKARVISKARNMIGRASHLCGSA